MTWLDAYIETRRAEVAAERATLQAFGRVPGPAVRDFRAALAAQAGALPAVIAEVKFRSPSQGWLRPACDVEAVAEGYARGGAACLSVLVDGPHFGGRLAYLTRARSASGLPVLAKGFFVDPDEVAALRAVGADALLLIARCLDRNTLAAMADRARSLGMAALVELHHESDLDLLAGLDLDLVGVNHRDLDSLALDLDLSRRLAPRLPAEALRVAESGLSETADLLRMRALGYGAVLVGTAFMRQADPGEGLRQLREGAHV